MWNFYGGEVDLTFFFNQLVGCCSCDFQLSIVFFYLSRMEKHVYMLCFAFFLFNDLFNLSFLE